MTDPQMPSPEPFTINQNLARRIQDEIGQNVFLCYQCIKCTSGCPVAEFFDWQPNQIMRALQLGDGADCPPCSNTLVVRFLPDLHHSLPPGPEHRRHHGFPHP